LCRQSWSWPSSGPLRVFPTCRRFYFYYLFFVQKKNLKSQRPELFYVLLGWGTDFPEFLQLRFVREQFVNKYSKKVIESHLKVRSSSEKGTCVS
jgi:hypothetical protein